ncbi:ABC transporter permease [Sporosarcina saromensis]|uniref:ABC transporter permease n=1 Tax=Sporosarcina saromensis TaxID=359365 RepID=A0ABU4GH65_9BACL|nr:ABC transporter permease [Sporosarcina saromensis]MDW0114952.1 ABC transporter permease [Sporosarcina saromensis]
MNISLKRVNAIFQKDFKDFSRNWAVSSVLFVPIGLGFMYGRAGVEDLTSHYLLINLAMAMVATFVQCCLIAEEKEKNTLRGLMLSPASTMEIIGGKSLLSFILTLGVIVLTSYLSGYQPADTAVIVVAVVLSSLFYIAIGTILGLYSKSVMEASLIVMPVILIFSLGSFITQLADSYPILKVALYLPNIQLIELATKVEAGGSFGDVLVELGIIAAWVVVSFIATNIIYRKRMID